jgi:hypothetical protein
MTQHTIDKPTLKSIPARVANNFTPDASRRMKNGALVTRATNSNRDLPLHRRSHYFLDSSASPSYLTRPDLRPRPRL